MKILVTGGSGQVGFELKRRLTCLGEIYAPSRAELDLSNMQAVAAYVKQLTPALIVNAAAYTAVDNAEKEPVLAQRLNAALPEKLAQYASDFSIPLVHYSSDYVYSGHGEEAWQEDSKTEPASVYGLTKLAGDQAVRSSGCEYLILRTSWVYSAHGRNFMKTMLRLAEERKFLKIVKDQIGAPTPARLIADVTLIALYEFHHGRMDTGLYHLATCGETSWQGFANEIFRLARTVGTPLALEPGQVFGIPTSECPTLAERPLNSRLALKSLEEALSIKLPDWRSQLALTLDEYLSRY